MKYSKYDNANDFLTETESCLEKNEAENNLILGICTRLKNNIKIGEAVPFFATVHDEQELTNAAVMTPPWEMMIYGEENAKALSFLVDNITKDGIDLPGVTGKADIAETFARIWAFSTGARFKIIMNMRVYKLEEVKYNGEAEGKIRIAEKSDDEVIAKWMNDFDMEALHGESDIDKYLKAAERRIEAGQIYVWEDGGKPVSIAASARKTKNGVTLSMVYTPPELRKKGYATSCVAGLSEFLLKTNKFCALFTDLSNPISNSIYQKIGYIPLCDFTQYKFIK